MVWTGCSSHRVLLEHERNRGLGMDAPVTVFSLKRKELWFGHGCSSHCILLEHKRRLGHGCSSHRILLEHEQKYGLGMDALVTVLSWKPTGIMVGTGCSRHRILLKRTELWFGHGYSGHRILLEHERNYGLSMAPAVRVPREYSDKSMHAELIIPFVIQENTVTRASMPKP